MPCAKDFAWTHCTPISGPTKVKCNWCLNHINGGIYRFKWHLAKELGNNTIIYPKCPPEITYQERCVLEGISKGKAKKSRTGNEVESNSTNDKRNHLDGGDGAHVFSKESGLTPSTTCGPNTSGGNINFSSHLILH